jgi:hypothetical protein
MSCIKAPKSESFSGGKLTLPVAATVFPREIYRAPKSWAEQTYSNLIYWNEAEHGGHFAAFEQPDIFVEEMRSAFRKIKGSVTGSHQFTKKKEYEDHGVLEGR